MASVNTKLKVPFPFAAPLGYIQPYVLATPCGHLTQLLPEEVLTCSDNESSSHTPTNTKNQQRVGSLFLPTQLCMCVHMCVYMCVYMCVHVYVHECTCVCTCVYMCVYMCIYCHWVPLHEHTHHITLYAFCRHAAS